MKNKINFRNSIIGILCFALIFVSIGFIVLSVRFENVKNKQTIFDVQFSKIKKINSVKGGTKEPSGSLEIDNNGKVLSFNFDLRAEHDEIDYEVTIKNNGTVEAEIIDLLMSPDYMGDFKNSIVPISIVVSDISGKILEPNEETTIKISAFCNSSQKERKIITGKIGLIAATK